MISRSLVILIVTPSGLNHSTLGRDLELDVSQSKYSVSPSLRVVIPVITGGLKTIFSGHKLTYILWKSDSVLYTTYSLGTFLLSDKHWDLIQHSCTAYQ